MIWSPRSSSSSQRADAALVWSLRGAGALSVALLLLVVVFLVAESWPALRQVGAARWFADPAWRPLAGQYALWPMLAGTVFVTAAALFVAAPLGLAAALFSTCYAPRAVGHPLDRALELMAGVPSVVYGLWGLSALAPLIARWQPPGTSLLCAAVVLALMVLPTVALTSRAALAAVPAADLQAAAALGLSRWATIRAVLLPAARGGIIAGIVLAGARALGETMAVLMVAGNVNDFPRGLLAPVRTLSANIALEMGYATSDHRAALYVSGLALMLLVAALAVAGHALKGRSRV